MKNRNGISGTDIFRACSPSSTSLLPPHQRNPFGLNILNKSYIHSIYLFKFVNTYDVVCSSLYHSILSMKETKETF